MHDSLHGFLVGLLLGTTLTSALWYLHVRILNFYRDELEIVHSRLASLETRAASFFGRSTSTVTTSLPPSSTNQ